MSEALRLADELTAESPYYAAAAELRRLDKALEDSFVLLLELRADRDNVLAENDKLRAAAELGLEAFDMNWDEEPYDTDWAKVANAAIAALKEVCK